VASSAFAASSAISPIDLAPSFKFALGFCPNALKKSDTKSIAEPIHSTASWKALAIVSITPRKSSESLYASLKAFFIPLTTLITPLMIVPIP